MNDRGDIGLPAAIGAGAIGPAILVANLVDGTLGICLGVAVAAGGLMGARTIWREFVRPVLAGARALAELPDRFEKLERHQHAHLKVTSRLAEHLGLDITDELAELDPGAPTRRAA